MKKLNKIKNNKWVRIFSNKYLLILILFVFWMIFIDTNSYFIHKELNENIEKLEETKETYYNEIIKDKIFIDKMNDSNELEKFAREKYYLKKKNEDIYIIEYEDSLKIKSNE